jgi:hypothetical protein
VAALPAIRATRDDLIAFNLAIANLIVDRAGLCSNSMG